MRSLLAWLALTATALGLLGGRAAVAAPLVVDRAVVRFHAPEMGGPERPKFVLERILAFEARIEALSDAARPEGDAEPYRERHVSAALERHISEVLLASLHIDPEPSESTVSRQAELAEKLLYDRVGGEPALSAAARAEGVSRAELTMILRRQARASLYLDRMVTPMLRPSDAELELSLRSAPAELQNETFQRARPLLLRFYVSRRLSAALSSFYQESRSRVVVTLL